MKIKKLLLIILTLCVVIVSSFSIFQLSAQTTEGTFTQVLVKQKNNIQKTKSQIKKFVINNKDDFLKFMMTPEYWECNYKITLNCDIDMQGIISNSIETFSGQFDGRGHTVSNLSFKYFAKNNNGTILGINFKNGKLLNDNECGFVLYNSKDGLIGNCSIDMDSEDLNIKAGFVYENKGKITNSKTKLSIKSEDNTVGGFVSDNYGIIENCTAIGNVKGNKYVGGFVGNNSGGTITNCTSKGNVNGYIDVGGFAGDNSGGTITNCTSTGNVNGNEYVGGFLGFNVGVATDCKFTGDINGNNIVGGFVGCNYKMIKECISTGNVNSEKISLDKFAGYNYAKIENSKIA